MIMTCINLLNFALFSYATVVVGQTIQVSRCRFSDFKWKPDDAQRVEEVLGVGVKSACIARCQRREDCQSLVYTETTRLCTLYNSSTGQLSLNTGEMAIVKSLNCSSMSEEHILPLPASSIESCDTSSSHTPCTMVYDGDLHFPSVWVTIANSPPDWIQFIFDRERKLYAIDYWRSHFRRHQCEQMELSNVAATQQHIMLPCQATTQHTLVQIDIRPYLQTSTVKIECLVKCTLFYFGFNEIVFWGN